MSDDERKKFPNISKNELGMSKLKSALKKPSFLFGGDSK